MSKIYTVLLVDDDPDYLFQVAFYLRKAGFEVMAVESQAEAEQVIAKMTASDENRAALSKNGLKAVIPQGTEIQISIQNGEARVNLVNLPVMPDYDSEQQLFAAVVNTLTEFDSIETVSIFLKARYAKMC